MAKSLLEATRGEAQPFITEEWGYDALFSEPCAELEISDEDGKMMKFEPLLEAISTDTIDTTIRETGKMYATMASKVAVRHLNTDQDSRFTESVKKKPQAVVRSYEKYSLQAESRREILSLCQL